MSESLGLEVVARLPLLGPVIGWTRPDAAGGILARHWIRADDIESEPPFAVLTALCDRNGAVRAGSVQLWKPVLFDALHTRAGHRMHFGIADVPVPAAVDWVVRMVSLHRIILPGESRSTVLDARHVSTDYVQVVHVGEPSDAPPVADLPTPQRFDLAALLPGLEGALERLAQQAFNAVDKALAGGRAVASQPLPPTLSRKRLRIRRLDECETALSSSSQVQLARRDGRIAFAAGSCRHPGTAFERERSGRTLEALAAAAAAPQGPAFALLTGDQIYADASGGVFDVETRYEKFVARYERAFGAEAFRRVATRIPLYMAADDHEIGDGWSLARLRAMNLQDAERDAHERAYDWGRTLFCAHQRLHGPDASLRGATWYRFEAAGLPFFVMDTRFERFAHTPSVERRLLNEERKPRLLDKAQKDELSGWLSALAGDEGTRTIPKFIVSGAVFAPGIKRYAEDLPAARAADNWQGFAQERAWLASEIAARKLENVVFLSGDYHCAAVAALALGEGQSGIVSAYAIVSPPLFAPYPFANTRAQEICTREPILDPARGAPVAWCDSHAVEGEGFTLVRVAPDGARWAIEVEFHRATPQGDHERYFYARLAEGRVTRLSLTETSLARASASA
jgi:cholesterol oxidase